MKNTRDPLRLLLPAASTSLLLLAGQAQAEIVVGWEMTGQTAFGTQGLAPSFADQDVTVGGLTRGAGFGTTGTAAGNAWGGNGFEGPATAADAITAENFITFTVAPDATFEFSAGSLSVNYRRSSGGATKFALQYQIGAGAFTDIGEFDLGSSSSAGSTVTGIDLSGIPALQDVAADTVTFRVVPFGSTDPNGTFYFYGPLAGFDLRLDGSVQTIGSTGDTDPPVVASFSPPDESNNITVDGAEVLSIVFNENITVGTGNVLVKTSAGATVATIDINDFDKVSLIDNRIDITLPAPLTAGGSYYVEIPNTAITDLAGSPNAYAGVSGPTGWNFTIASAATNPTVVINKYLNGSPDRVELLVIGSGIPGSTVDMRGMILKDFSSNMGGDGGGAYTFSTDAIWSAVEAGTLITASKTSASPDTDAADFTLSVGLDDATYFTAPGSGTFDISTTEMVMIKAAGSAAAGTTDGIHALAAGTSAGALFTSFTGAKLRATTTTPTNQGVIATTPPSARVDYISGTNATAGLALSASNFGAPNNGTNAAYIAELRGLIPGDGDGIATITNLTSGTYENLPVFDDGQTGQTAKVTLTAQIPGATVTNATITVPASLGTPTTATVGGAGGAGANAVVAGQTITITGASFTTANPLEVTINGLTTPVPTDANLGAYPLAISTSASGGTLTPIASQPAVRVLIPISFVRDVSATGVALDIGATVAIEGVVTEAEFGSGISNFSGFLQDTSGGINVFASATNPNLVRDNRFVIVGSILQFNGLTEITPLNAASSYNLGSTTAATPQVVSLATLLADPESYEGELITVQNLSYVSGAWGASSTVVLQSGATNIDVRIQAGSTATAEPSYPVNVTGVFGQFDSSNPFTAGYQLMPRDAADLTPGTLGGFDAWAAANGIPGELPTGDFDKDGIANLVEYALGLSPTAVNAAPGTLSGGVLTFTKGAEAMTNGDVDWAIEDSTTLGAAPDPWTPVVAVEAGNTIAYALPTGQGKIFARLTVTQVTPP